MLTRMRDEDWAPILRVFEAARSRSGDKGRNDRQFLEALRYFSLHNVTWRALPAEFGQLEALLATEPAWRVRGVLRSALR